MVPWICCQLGAREHYAIPRALFRLGMLDWLVTDAWVPPSSFLAKIVGDRAQRSEIGFTNELSDARVTAFNSSLDRYSRCLHAHVGSADGQKYLRATAGSNAKSSTL